MTIDLKGKNVLVCGSSKGIGKAIALKFAKAGANVTSAARNEALMKKMSLTIKSNNFQWLAVDFQNYSNAIDIIKEHKKNNGEYDIIINNAGGPPPGKLIDADISDFIKAFERHLFFSHELMKISLENMKKNKWGRIINIISISVKQPVENLGVSNTLRGAMASWGKTLSKELGEFGITVNNLLPGQTMTERLVNLIEDQAEKSGKSFKDIKDKMIHNIPTGRIGEAEDLANAALFLASEHSSFINGINLPVDGGFLSTL